MDEGGVEEHEFRVKGEEDDLEKEEKGLNEDILNTG